MKTQKNQREKVMHECFDLLKHNKNSDLLQLDANSFISIRLDEEIEPTIPSYDRIYDILLNDYKKSEKVRFFEESIKQLFTNYDLSEAIKLNKIVHLYDEKITRRLSRTTRCPH